MKLLGVTVLLLSTSGAGIYLSRTAKERVRICRALISLCDTLSLDISYRRTPLFELIGTACRRELGFITPDCIKKKSEIKSCLSCADNEELSDFLFRLGKSDAESQLRLISAFRAYAGNALERCSAEYAKNSKLYVSIGVLGGAVLSLILI